MPEDILFKMGNCPVCDAQGLPLRCVRNNSGMVAWICDPCLTKFNNRGRGGGIKTR